MAQELILHDSNDLLKKATVNSDGSLSIIVFGKHEATGEIAARKGGVMLTKKQFKTLEQFFLRGQ
jgi:hypothetical protein